MSVITTKGNSRAQALLGTSFEVLVTGAIIAKASEEQVFTAVKNAILKSYLDLGYKTPEDKNILAVMIREITTDIKSKYPSLRIEEIKTAFENGVMGEYGEYMGLSRVTFNMFLKAYYTSQKRVNAVMALLESEKSEKPQPTESEKERTYRQNALNLYETFLQGKPVNDFGNSVYNYLDKLGLIKFSTAEKNKFMAEAKRKVEAGEHVKAVTGDLFAMQAARKALEQIEAGNEEGRVIAEAKRIALVKFFEGLSIHLKEMI